MYSLRSEIKDDVLWVTATGTRTRETVLAMAKDILAACADNKLRKVIVDVRALEGRLPPTDTYEIVNKHFPGMRERNVITQAALVDLKEFEHSYRFFENVAVNRGFNLQIFSDPDEAAAWLSGTPGT